MFELNEKYIKIDGSFVLSGPQAIVKLALLQKEIDERNGLNTAGYVSGYRGSPLGVVDKEFSSQSKLLTDKSIKFKPAVNEDLAVAAIQGTQQLGLLSPSKVDGVLVCGMARGLVLIEVVINLSILVSLAQQNTVAY